MKVAVLHGPRDLRIEDEPDLSADPEPNQIRVRTLVTGLSAGTELNVYTRRFGDAFYGWNKSLPTELGYLNVGRVAAVGAGVTGVQPGDVIYTRKGHRQEHLISQDELFWKVPAGLRPEVAVFTYLINLGLHALRRGGLIPGEHVAVVGLGPIGLGAVAMARTFGSPVVGIDPVAERRELACHVGVDAALDPTAGDFPDAIAAFGGEAGIDLVVETASTWSAIRTAAEVVRQEGRVSIVALHPGEAEYNPIGEPFYRKQLALISTSFAPLEDYPSQRVRFTLRRNCQYILDGLAAGRIGYAPAVTHEVHFSELPAIFERLAEGDRTMGAVAVHWE
ncbi:MAG TPA: zinc-binding dehydrogenase [Chloroflexota bacterium]|nr:zinc-binding dehydrogenase [Chloroflexota bacterium]